MIQSGMSATGHFTGVFYPRNSNPSSFITSGQTGVFKTQQDLDTLYYATLSYVSSYFYPNSNPNNYLSSTDGQFVVTTGNQNISGDLSVFNLLSSGRVGIGNPTPIYALDVNGVIGNSLSYKSGAVINLTRAELIEQNGNNSVCWDNHVLRRSTNNITVDWENWLLYSHGNSSVDWGNRHLDDENEIPTLYWSSGKVGILQSSPQYTLDVNGAGNFLSGLFISGQSVLTTIGISTVNLNANKILKSPSSGSISMHYGDGTANDYYAGMFVTANIYSYKSISGTKNISQNPLVLQVITSGLNMSYSVPASWNSVDDVDGYFVTLFSNQHGEYDQKYLFTTYNSFQVVSLPIVYPIYSGYDVVSNSYFSDLTGISFPNSISSYQTDLNINAKSVIINGDEKVMGNFILSGNAPTTSSSSGTKGQIAINGIYLFVATGNNQWGRIALSSF